ncbi:hypothetical protein Gotur_001804, partial [Gossypium turneri]
MLVGKYQLPAQLEIGNFFFCIISFCSNYLVKSFLTLSCNLLYYPFILATIFPACYRFYTIFFWEREGRAWVFGCVIITDVNCRDLACMRSLLEKMTWKVFCGMHLICAVMVCN